MLLFKGKCEPISWMVRSYVCYRYLYTTDMIGVNQPDQTLEISFFYLMILWFKFIVLFKVTENILIVNDNNIVFMAQSSSFESVIKMTSNYHFLDFLLIKISMFPRVTLQLTSCTTSVPSTCKCIMNLINEGLLSDISRYVGHSSCSINVS